MEEFVAKEDFFDHSYYKLAKVLSQFTGQWPLRSTKTNFCLCVLLIVTTFQISTQILAVIHYRDHFEIVIAAIPPFLIDMVCIVKLFNVINNSAEMRQLLTWMMEDWKIIDKDEQKILQKYAFIGKILAMGYASLAYSTAVIFLFEPKISDKLGKMFQSNYTTPIQGIYPIPMYFGGLNVDGFYYWTLIVAYFDCVIVVSISISNDTLFIVYLQHICGRFAGLGHRVRNLPVSTDLSKDEGFEYIRECVIEHKRLLKFANILESTYVWCFLCVVGCNMILVSLTAIQASIEELTVQSALKFGMFTSIQIVHLFFECFMSQQLINHSGNIHTCLYDAMWYKNSVKTQRVIKIMLMRCQIPCKIMAGTIELSMETFSQILKSSVSYFTVFQSMQ